MADKSVQDAADTSADVDTSVESIEEAMDDDTSFETEEDNQPDESNEAEESKDTSDFDEGANDDVAEEPKEKEEEAEAEESDTEEEPADDAEVEDTATEDEKSKKGEPDPDKARDAFKERELRRQIQKEEREKQEKITLDKYLKEAADDEDELAKRQLEVEAYNINKERAALNQDKIISGITKAKADMPLLSSKDPVIQDFIGDALDEYQATRVVTNEHGDILSINEDVYQYLQKKVDSISKLTGIGARQESQNKVKQKSRTMTTPSAKPKKDKTDPEMDGFDEEANRW